MAPSKKRSRNLTTVKLGESRDGRFNVNISEFRGTVYYHIHDSRLEKSVSLPLNVMYSMLGKKKKALVDAGKECARRSRKGKASLKKSFKDKNRKDNKRRKQTKVDDEEECDSDEDVEGGKYSHQSTSESEPDDDYDDDEME